MNCFRPNIVISGGEPYIEDKLRMVRIGDVGVRIVKPCYRCVITATDQATAVVGKEPLATLATYRKDEKGVKFGMNAIHDNPGVLRVRDTVDVWEYCS